MKILLTDEYQVYLLMTPAQYSFCRVSYDVYDILI